MISTSMYCHVTVLWLSDDYLMNVWWVPPIYLLLIFDILWFEENIIQKFENVLAMEIVIPKAFTPRIGKAYWFRSHV